MQAKVQRITLPPGQRVICISDIHGRRDLLEALLRKVQYTPRDALVLVGDLYTKGPDGHATLQAIRALAQSPGVYVLRGNCDWAEPYLSEAERAWLEGLPHILDAGAFVCVHGGLASEDLDAHEEWACMKNDAFLEQGLCFDRYVIAGHWPTGNYTHEIACNNPIVCHEQRIVAIDGGTVIRRSGQLNAFIMQDGAFSFEAVDSLPTLRIERAQTARGGTLNVTWNDRFLTLLEEMGTLARYRHERTNIELMVPQDCVWQDEQGRLCAGHGVTDHWLGVMPGDTVSVVADYDDRMLVKRDGIEGWLSKP